MYKVRKSFVNVLLQVRGTRKRKGTPRRVTRTASLKKAGKKV